MAGDGGQAGTVENPSLVRERRIGPAASSLWPVGVLVANCVVAVLLFSNTWAHPASSWIGDSHDPKFIIWALALTSHSLATFQRHPLFTDFMLYPTGLNLMWNISLIFPGVVLWPVTALLGPVVSYNAAMTGALAASGWCAYLVVRRYASNEFVSALAGMLYGFSPFMILHSLGHLHMIIAVFPPLVWLLLDELLVRRRWPPIVVGLLLGAAGAAQLLTSTELLATTVLVAAFGLVLLAVLHPRQVGAVTRRALVAGAVALVTFAVLGAYPLKNLLFGPARPSGTINTPDVYVADLVNFVVPVGYRILSALWSWPITVHYTGTGVENGGVYLGLSGLVVFVTALVVGWRWGVVRFAGLLTAGVVVLSMGAWLHVNGRVTRVPLPWTVIRHVPLMANIIPVRLAVFMWLGLVVVVGVVASRFLARGRRATIGVAIAAVFLIVPIFPTPPMLSTPASAPAFFTSGGEVSRIPQGSVALIVPFSDQDSLTAMYWQAVSNFRFRMPEGTGYHSGPPSLSPPPSQIQTDLVELEVGNYPSRPLAAEQYGAWFNLRQWNVDTVVVGPTPGESRVVAYFTRVIGRPPERTGGVHVWWNVRVSDPLAPP